MRGQTVILRGDAQRVMVKRLIDAAPPNAVVNIQEARRTLDQNAKFHAICSDVAKSKYEWAGKPRSAAVWKLLFVSAHTKATNGTVEFVAGLEGEAVNIRESTAHMSVGRANSLIEYCLAFCAQHEIPLNDTRKYVGIDVI